MQDKLDFCQVAKSSRADREVELPDTRDTLASWVEALQYEICEFRKDWGM